MRIRTLGGVGCAALIMAMLAWPARPSKNSAAIPPVTTVRVPNGGIQPQAALDKGVLHLIYYSGDSSHGDLYYVRSENYGATFSTAIRVNTHPGSAIAAGNIRGAHIAIGRNGRVHVAWNGTYEVNVPGADKPWMKHPMVYTRLNDAGTGFEPERNVVHQAYGLDGGGALAADRAGDVYVFWHAPMPGMEGEGNRRVWMARSGDDGKAFEPEKPVFEKPTGACGCCGMSAFADERNNLYVMYRSATETVNRDMYLLVSQDRGQTFEGADISPWKIGACTMSLEYLSTSSVGVLASWETKGNVYYGVVKPGTTGIAKIIVAPGEADGRKYPIVVGNNRGDILLAWAEGMKWGKGGSVEWQVFDRNGNPEGGKGHADGIPAWSLVAAFSHSDSGFTVV